MFTRTRSCSAVHVFEQLAEQSGDPGGFQQQLLAMLDGYTDYYQEYRRDLGLFHESVRERLHYLFTSIYAWREVQRLILRREDLFKAGHGKGVPPDEVQSMREMAPPLLSAAQHALAAVVAEYGRVYRFFLPRKTANRRHRESR